jgi:5-methylcytosine-specific restriction endonuclease McrA
VKESGRLSAKVSLARRRRQALVEACGGRCSVCGSTEHLQFDCVVRQGPAHHLLSWPARVRFYWRQKLLGNLQLLCASCHLRKTVSENCKGRGTLSLPRNKNAS